MMDWWRQRSSFVRLLAYAVAAILLLVVAAGVGAVAALVVGGNVSLPTGESTRPDGSGPPGEQSGSVQRKRADANNAQQQYSDTKRGQATPQDKQTTYLHEVGEIQANSVDAFLDSHEKLLRYDALTSDDVEKMQANQAALKGLADQAGALKAPQKYRDHKDAFLSAIDELHQAAKLAYALAADPVSATNADFGRYDHLVNEAAAGLQRSDEILGKDYKSIEGIRGVGASQ